MATTNKHGGAPQAALHARRRQVLRSGGALALLGAWAAGNAWADLPALVAASRGAVLPVGTFNALESPRFGFRGSGFVVGDGTLLVTNAHVLPDASVVPVPQLAVLVNPRGSSADVRRATLLQTDRVHDLALLRLEGPPLPALSLAESAVVREGMDLAVMGYPIGGVLGFSTVTHRGILASITAIALPSLTARQLEPRALAQLREGPFEIYQLDATAYPGSSGGPVIDVGSGAVIGVLNMVLVRGTRESALSSPTGISYAVPVRFVKALLAQPR